MNVLSLLDLSSVQMSSDKSCAMKFRYATRFIDDECNLNDDDEFGRSFREIYPDELELKCEHQGTHATFLQLDITIRDGIAIYKLFEKRDNFSFHFSLFVCWTYEEIFLLMFFMGQ